MIDHDIALWPMDNKIWFDGVGVPALLEGRLGEDVQLIKWSKAQQTGYIQLKNGEEYDFTDESVIAQFVTVCEREIAVKSDTPQGFTQRNESNAFDVSAAVDPPRAAKAQEIADLRAAAAAKYAAWRSELNQKRKLRRQELADKNAARKAAFRQNQQGVVSDR